MSKAHISSDSQAQASTEAVTADATAATAVDAAAAAAAAATDASAAADAAAGADKPRAKAKSRSGSKTGSKTSSKAKGKKGSKEADVLDPEVIKEHWKKALDFESKVLLVPMRHHSPAMALHLPRIIDAYQPDHIAVEMPYAYQEICRDLIAPGVVPPVAFFSYGTTKVNKLVPENEDDPDSELVEQTVEVPFNHLYPMLEQSPEYVAIREAVNRNIDFSCIDLSSCETDYLDELEKAQAQNELAALMEQHAMAEGQILLNALGAQSSDSSDDGLKVDSEDGADTAAAAADEQRKALQMEAVKHLKSDSSFGEIIECITENSGSLSFEEFWDRCFEINALGVDTLTYLRDLYIYCYVTRKGSGDREGLANVQRELFMLKQITAASKKYSRVLVLTGGSHSVALCDYLYYKKAKDKPVKFGKIKNNSFIIPFSWRRADAQDSYGAGMVFPFFYFVLYRAIKDSMSFNPSLSLKLASDLAAAALSAAEDASVSVAGNSAHAESGNSESANAESGSSDPADAESGNSDSADAKSGNSDPADAKSGNSDSADAQSGNSDPADAQSEQQWVAVACDHSQFEHWNDPLSAIRAACKVYKIKDSKDEADDEQGGRKKKKDSSSDQTPSGPVDKVLDLIKSLGSVAEQAKIKDPKELNALAARAVAANAMEGKGDGAVSDSADNQAETADVAKTAAAETSVELSPSQRIALLSYRADHEQLIAAAEAACFYFSRQLRDYRGRRLATAVQIDCNVMLKGLCAIRDKLAPSVFELIDAVKSTCIKEELGESHYMLLNLQKALTSLPSGSVPLNVNVPPLWRDFVLKARKFGMKTEIDTVSNATIDIFKDEKNILKGQFFAQAAFIDPDSFTKLSQETTGNTVRRRETYNYCFRDSTIMAIIRAAEHGEDMATACRKLVRMRLESSRDSLSELCTLFSQCVDMGIDEILRKLAGLIRNAISSEKELGEVAEALNILSSYSFIAKVEEHSQTTVDQLNSLVLDQALRILSQLNDVTDDEVDDFVDNIQCINYYFGKYDSHKEAYCTQLRELIKDDAVGSTLQGCYLSLLFKNKEISYEEFESHVDQFVYGSILSNNDCIGFFYGIIKISRAGIFYRNGIMKLLNAYIESLRGEEFLKVLIMLKRCFADFSKVEIFKVLKLLRKIHGLSIEQVEFEVSPEDYVANMEADRIMYQQMSRWLDMPDWSMIDQHSSNTLATPGLVEDLTGRKPVNILNPAAAAPQSHDDSQRSSADDDILLDDEPL